MTPTPLKWLGQKFLTTPCFPCGMPGVVTLPYIVHFHPLSLLTKDADDNGQLFSGYDFQGNAIGYATIGEMCKVDSGGINQVTISDGRSAMLVAHEMGHNFGLYHDGTNNMCIPEFGFVMFYAVCIGCGPIIPFSTCR